MIESQSSSVTAAIGFRLLVAAQLTRMSSRPNASCAFCTSPRAASMSPSSAVRQTVFARRCGQCPPAGLPASPLSGREGPRRRPRPAIGRRARGRSLRPRLSGGPLYPREKRVSEELSSHLFLPIDASDRVGERSSASSPERSDSVPRRSSRYSIGSLHARSTFDSSRQTDATFPLGTANSHGSGRISHIRYKSPSMSVCFDRKPFDL